MSDKPSRLNGREFEDALGHAETYLKAYEETVVRTRLLASAGTASLAFGIGMTAVALATFVNGGVHAAGAALICAAVLFVFTGITIYGHGVRLRLAGQRDERAALDIIHILRELLPDIADMERWSPARYQLTKARVARFPIGRKKPL